MDAENQPQPSAQPEPVVAPNPVVQPAAPSGIESMIPYNNGKALAAYYLGVFGLIPFLGLLLSVLAVIFGMLGLKQHKLHPEKKGRTHALVGLWLGIFELVVFAIFVIFMIVVSVTDPTRT